MPWPCPALLCNAVATLSLAVPCRRFVYHSSSAPLLCTAQICTSQQCNACAGHHSALPLLFQSRLCSAFAVLRQSKHCRGLATHCLCLSTPLRTVAVLGLSRLLIAPAMRIVAQLNRAMRLQLTAITCLAASRHCGAYLYSAVSVLYNARLCSALAVQCGSDLFSRWAWRIIAVPPQGISTHSSAFSLQTSSSHVRHAATRSFTLAQRFKSKPLQISSEPCSAVSLHRITRLVKSKPLLCISELCCAYALLSSTCLRHFGPSHSTSAAHHRIVQQRISAAV